LRAQTTLEAQALGLAAPAVEGIGAMARLRGQPARAYWELDEAAMTPVGLQRLQPVLEHPEGTALRCGLSATAWLCPALSPPAEFWCVYAISRRGLSSV
jgi:hypothetical protein